MQGIKEALKFTLRWEGGYVNNPKDPGGATNMGITQGTFDAWCAKHKVKGGPVKDISKATAIAIYTERYWTPSRAAYLAWPLSLVVFDTAVNFGVGRSVQFLKDALGLGFSAQWTEETSRRVHQANPKELAVKIVQGRMAYRHKRVLQNPSQKVFLKGWLNRDTALLKAVEGP